MADGTATGEILTWNGSSWIGATPLPENNMQPSLAINYIIALQGIFPSRSSAEPFIGEIIMFGGNFAPRGWAFCDGQLLPIAQNTALFSIIGTTYGGDGRTTFALPDLRGRVPVGEGSGPGLTPRTLGAKFGTETH
ncbi:tail fiber protein [Marinobacterium sp. YM272]|uniref:phage tail protein n=1 Tax=Marinobacterium sp. YM272 TaxID=3421654 RepID=UPI003D7FEC6D